MEVFEIRFNSNKKENVFDTLIYQPSSLSKKKMGELYVIGEINLPTKEIKKILSSFFSLVKKEYYSSSQKPETSFFKTLKKANVFFKQKREKGEFDWTGLFHSSIVVVKNFFVYFAKTGKIKILLMRGKSLMELGEELRASESGSGPFGSVVSGKLLENDKLLIFSSELGEFFEKEKRIFGEFLKISNKDDLKKFLKSFKSLFSSLSGVALVFIAKKEKIKERESFKNKNKKENLKKKTFSFLVWNDAFFRKTILIISLVFLLIVGFLVFHQSKTKNLKIQDLKKIESKLKEVEFYKTKGESYLIINDKKRARENFKKAKEILQSINPQFSLPETTKTHLNILKKEIEKFLND